MQAHIITGLIFIAGLIKFAPVIGAISGAKLTGLYERDFSDPPLELLMRHRAVLFGIVGGFMCFAAFTPGYQMPAIVMGLISMIGFIVLARLIPGSAKTMKNIIWADVIGILCLLTALALLVK